MSGAPRRLKCVSPGLLSLSHLPRRPEPHSHADWCQILRRGTIGCHSRRCQHLVVSMTIFKAYDVRKVDEQKIVSLSWRRVALCGGTRDAVRVAPRPLNLNSRPRASFLRGRTTTLFIRQQIIAAVVKWPASQAASQPIHFRAEWNSVGGLRYTLDLCPPILSALLPK